MIQRLAGAFVLTALSGIVCNIIIRVAPEESFRVFANIALRVYVLLVDMGLDQAEAEAGAFLGALLLPAALIYTMFFAFLSMKYEDKG